MAKFCTKCGTQLEDDKKFCTSCGVSVEAADTAKVQPSTPQQPVHQYPINQNKSQQTQQSTSYDGDMPPAAGSKYEPISTGGYIGIMLLMCIPVIGIVIAIIWALGGCRKVNKRNLARAALVMMAIGLVISLILGFAVKAVVTQVADTVEQEVGISIAGEDDNGGLLQGLSNLTGLAGDSDSSGENSDLEDLKELSNALKSLEAISGEDEGSSDLSSLIDNVESINAEAEKNNDGWPKSLRKYPGGTATAVTSYRTEITDTSREEMMGWIEDLKKDGFEYQDFYDFGMTEADMLSVDGWWATDGDIYLSISWDGTKVIVDHTNELPDMSGMFE